MAFSARNCCSLMGNLRKISLDGDKMESRIYRRMLIFCCSLELNSLDAELVAPV
jgi:hypothetical protein